MQSLQAIDITRFRSLGASGGWKEERLGGKARCLGEGRMKKESGEVGGNEERNDIRDSKHFRYKGL